jgi:uncharacterized protein YndB with AHSA1/START domain
MAPTTAATQPAAALGKGYELVIARTFDAPRELVFNAWTDPSQLVHWWGPKGFTNPRCEADVRPGGKIRIDMRAPDGTIYPMGGEFREITPPDRIVFISCALDADGNSIFDILNTVTFSQQEGKTILNLRAEVIRADANAPQYLAGMQEGWQLSLDRLENFVVPNVADREIILSRTFDAPRELVFDAWTTPEHLVHWYGPNGFTITIHEMDVRPGGIWRLTMHGPDGRDYNNSIVFIEVVRPNRLVYKHAPEPGSEFVGFETTVTFAAVGEKTQLTMRQLHPTAEARNMVVEKYHAIEGGKQTFARLAEYLTKL